MHQRLELSLIRTWRTFITASARLLEQIDQDLGRAGCIPMSWYDVLVELVDAPEQRLRMSELADRVVLSRSTLTHLVERLEAAGLLTRERCGTDRRGAYAVLTEQGRAALRQAWPVYANGIQTYFVQQLQPMELQLLDQGLGRVLVALAATSKRPPKDAQHQVAPGAVGPDTTG